MSQVFDYQVVRYIECDCMALQCDCGLQCLFIVGVLPQNDEPLQYGGEGEV